MSDNDLEIIVYLDDEHAETAIESLRSQFSVSQVASRQVVMVRVPAEQVGQVAAVEGVQGVFDHEFPQNLMENLNLSESLFVRAWSLRQSDGTKKRLGEGLDWDAEGFEAPGISEEDWI